MRRRYRAFREIYGYKPRCWGRDRWTPLPDEFARKGAGVPNTRMLSSSSTSREAFAAEGQRRGPDRDALVDAGRPRSSPSSMRCSDTTTVHEPMRWRPSATLNRRACNSRAVPYATFQAWQDRAGSLASLEAFDGTNLTLTELGAAERVSATDVTPGLLTLLGVAPAHGRPFDANDIGRPVAIISDEFWRGKLAADPAVIGRQIMLGGRAHTVVGVLPSRFSFALNRSAIWRPLPLTPAQAARAGYRVT